VRNVYLINLSFGLAGIERRFANLWRVLHDRGVVFPILVIPSALASLLQEANLLPTNPEGLIVISEPKPVAWVGNLKLPPVYDVPRGIVRTRIAVLGHRSVWRRIAQDKDAILHIGMNVSALSLPHVPTVYECVDANLEQLGGRHYRRASRRRCIVHCQTNRIRSALDALFAAQRPRWRTVTSPTYFAQYDGSQKTDDRDFHLIAFVGRLAREKNPLLFIEAIARARQHGSDCRAIMLGEGPLRVQCHALIKRYELESVVSIDFVPKPVDILRRASISVTLQPGDNYGSQSLLEAMGAGCAIIASDVGETKNIVTDEVGIRVPLTVEAVSKAIEVLVGSSEHTRQLGRRAEQIAKTKYSADAYASFLESLYEEAAQYYPASDGV